jgi:hypothetical protein
MTGERVGGCLGPYIDNPTITGMLDTIRDFLDPVDHGQVG